MLDARVLIAREARFDAALTKRNLNTPFSLISPLVLSALTISSQALTMEVILKHTCDLREPLIS